MDRLRGRIAILVVLAALACAALLPAAAIAENAGTPAPVSPNSPSSTDLVEHPKLWDGKTVTFRGEAIGERMVRGTYAWLHLNDDGYYLKNVEEGSGLHGFNSGMPVWVSAELADRIKVFGDHKHEGEVVEVRGAFNAACAQHGGDMDVHAVTLSRVLPGRHAIDQVRLWKVVVALLLAVVALLLWQAERSTTTSLARGAVTRKRA